MSAGRQPRQRILSWGFSRAWRAPRGRAPWGSVRAQDPREDAGSTPPRRAASAAGSGRALWTLLASAVMLLVLVAPQRSSSYSSGSSGVALLCSRVAGLSTRQRALCRTSPSAMLAVGTGLRLALQECQHQFRHERWNCSSAPHSNPHSMPLVVRVASREAAFSLAVQAAAVSWAAAAACARGELTGCSCAKRPSGPGAGLGPSPEWSPAVELQDDPHAQPHAEPHAASAFRWGGCSSDVEYGSRLSRTFTDAAHPVAPGLHGPNALDNAYSAPRRLMDNHNSKAGRKAVKLTLQKDCKCHGVSGSCSIRTCWTILAPFRVVGDHLMTRYRSAWPAVALPVHAHPQLPHLHAQVHAQVHAQLRARRHPEGLRLALRTSRNSRAPSPPRLPRRADLVFLQGSPNYCDPDVALGSLGTAGRTCNRTSRGADDCAVMCCGRGYNTRQVTISRQCRCKFYWCCYVHCDVCTDRYEEHTCK